MSIFNWINKIFNIDIKNPNPDLPSEFQLPTSDAENINAEMHNLEINNFTDSFSKRNQFDNDRNMFNFEVVFGNFDEIFGNFEDIFQNFQNQFNESNISAIPMNQPTNVEDFNGIPKQNFIAQSTFLNPSSRPLDQPSINITIKNSGSQYFEKCNFIKEKKFGTCALSQLPRWLDVESMSGSSISRSSYVSKNWNGRIIEKETSTNQLQNGIIETVTVMKDGNKQCVETITENSKTGEKMEKLHLSNLDQNELDELKKQFSKLF